MGLSRLPLTEAQLTEALVGLPGWARAGEGIERTYVLKDFSEAWAFMNRVALAAEKLDHHPNWSNVYSRVTIRLWTHDAGGVTEFDTWLARRIDAFVPAP